MVNVLQLSKALLLRPELPEVPGVRVRHFAGDADVESWLRLRDAAFARQRVGVRQWTSADFRAELEAKPWWAHQRMWLAEAPELGPAPKLIGSVTWADRCSAAEVRPAIHWLMVSPPWRRRGVGRLLLAALEASCWDAGYRQIWLETHTAWTAAGEFYRRYGYLPE